MSKKTQNYDNWEKPRFNRSDVLLVDSVRPSSTHGSLAIIKTTKWKRMTEETFSTLIDKDALSKKQIAAYMERKSIEDNGKRLTSVKNKIKSSEDFDLIIKLSKINMSTSKGITETRNLLKGKKNKSDLLKEAQKIRG